MVVDNDAHVRTVLAASPETAGMTVIAARDAVDALRWAHAVHPAAVITGIDLPGVDGCQLVQRLRRDHGLLGLPMLLFGERAHHSARCAALSDVHMVDRLEGTRAVVELLRALLPAENEVDRGRPVRGQLVAPLRVTAGRHRSTRGCRLRPGESTREP
jgi:DNA-binding response OmpR family regulator